MRAIYRVTFIFFCLLFSSSALAENYALNMDKSYELSSVSTGDNIVVRVVADRSYCCTIERTDRTISDDRVYFQAPTTNNGSLTSAANAFAEPVVAESDNENTRYCFTWTAGNNDLDLGGVALPIVSTGGSADHGVDVQCEETTLYGSFNTSVTDFNFIEISNVSLATNQVGAPFLPPSTWTGDVTVKVVARSSVSDSEVLNSTVVVQDGKRRDVDVHSVAPNTFGTVYISHNGPPGSIKAETFQYVITNSDPLNFQPVSSTIFTTRK